MATLHTTQFKLVVEKKTIGIDVQVNTARQDEEDPKNPGNLIEILKYGARCGNLMDLLFSDCASNQTYRSKTIQNEIIEICGKLITGTIVNEIKDAKFLTVLADEATDCSNVEQMAIVLRFIDNFFKVKKNSLVLFHVWRVCRAKLCLLR